MPPDPPKDTPRQAYRRGFSAAWDLWVATLAEVGPELAQEHYERGLRDGWALAVDWAGVEPDPDAPMAEV